MSKQATRKRHRRSKKQHTANNLLQSRARTMLKQVRNAIEGSSDESQSYANRFNSSIDRAAKKGGVHRRTAARLKAGIASKIAKLARASAERTR